MSVYLLINVIVFVVNDKDWRRLTSPRKSRRSSWRWGTIYSDRQRYLVNDCKAGGIRLMSKRIVFFRVIEEFYKLGSVLMNSIQCAVSIRGNEKIKIWKYN